jgi:hypothetical protein
LSIASGLSRPRRFETHSYSPECMERLISEVGIQNAA